MNFCVTDGESVVATRYISSHQDEAASLVCTSSVILIHALTPFSGTRPEQHSASTPKVAITECPSQTRGKTSLWSDYVVLLHFDDQSILLRLRASH